MAKKFPKNYVLSSGKHPWRICPIGYHWVNKHPRKEDKDAIVLVKGHCRRNPSNKDILEIDEIQEISSVFTSMLKQVELPNSSDLGFLENGKKYDELIGLWTKYWNEVFGPTEKLDPNLIKALMATESGFQEKPKAQRGHKAIGIMQIMPETINYLSSSKELKNFHIKLTQKDAREASINIAAAVRWLFRKHEVARARLKREPTWWEAVEEYKGIINDNSEIAIDIRKQLNKYLKILKDKK